MRGQISLLRFEKRYFAIVKCFYHTDAGEHNVCLLSKPYHLDKTNKIEVPLKNDKEEIIKTCQITK